MGLTGYCQNSCYAEKLNTNCSHSKKNEIKSYGKKIKQYDVNECFRKSKTKGKSSKLT